jgi:hypothetical protein
MKSKLFLLCFLGATAAFGQSLGAAMSNEAQAIELPSHPRTASRQPMGVKEDLMEESGSVYAQGERPLWEVAPKKTVVPLGDSARMLRKQHETAPKAEVIWEN